MEKIFRIYAYSWLAVVVAIILPMILYAIGVLETHHSVAQDPQNVKKIAKVDLPKISYTESSDNLERGTSCWDCFEQTAYFTEKLSDKCIRQLDRLCQKDSANWHKSTNGVCYRYTDENWQGGSYAIYCNIYEDHSYVEYYVDEIEKLTPFIIVAVIVIILIIALSILGIILFIIAIIRSISKRNEQHN